MANVLSTEKRALALQMLVEGMSMRAVQRTAGISLNTVYTQVGTFSDQPSVIEPISFR